MAWGRPTTYFLSRRPGGVWVWVSVGGGGGGYRKDRFRRLSTQALSDDFSKTADYFDILYSRTYLSFRLSVTNCVRSISL